MPEFLELFRDQDLGKSNLHIEYLVLLKLCLYKSSHPVRLHRISSSVFYESVK